MRRWAVTAMTAGAVLLAAGCFPPVSGGAYTLTVNKTGAGAGLVASWPQNITCGTECVDSFAAGAEFTLTAYPDAGSTFVGWSGACSGTAPCTLRMNGPLTVTAEFATV